jgi:hypothetical protein
MASRIALALAVLAPFTTGCVYSTESGAITDRMVSDWEGTKESEEGSWQGEPIIITADMGGIHVEGVEGKTNISITTRFVAGANSQEEAQPAYEDVAAGLQIELLNGTWYVSCPHAKEKHGIVVPSTTGCENLFVRVPTGSVEQPIDLTSKTTAGGSTAEKIVVSRLSLHAPFGVLAQVTPVVGADIEVYNEDLDSGDCPAELYLPQDFATDLYDLSIQRADLKRYDGEPLKINTSAFPDLTSPIGSRGAPGTGASRIVVRASIGDVTLGTGALPKIDKEGIHNCQNLDLEFEL